MRFLLGLILCVVLLSVGCSQVEKPDSSEATIPVPITVTPEPIPVPTVSVVYEPQEKVDERAMVIESLIPLNNSSNHYIRVLQTTNDIYDLQSSMLTPEEAQYHISYVASKVIFFSLMVYGDAIRNWTIPEESSYYDKLMEIKEAELYRIEYFSSLTEMMLYTVPTEDAEAIQVIHEKFLSWRDDPLNMKPINLQNALLTELNINPDEVNFLYVMPEKPLPILPPPFTDNENGQM